MAVIGKKYIVYKGSVPRPRKLIFIYSNPILKLKYLFLILLSVRNSLRYSYLNSSYIMDNNKAIFYLFLKRKIECLLKNLFSIKCSYNSFLRNYKLLRFYEMSSLNKDFINFQYNFFSKYKLYHKFYSLDYFFVRIPI